MKKPRTVAIIQARMGSRRLPGKVMMKVGGRPLLVYLVERISKARSLDNIVVATTVNPRDNVIIEECERRGIPNFRGSEEDVLGRYVSAARACDAGIVVRVTADNPLTDPDSIDRVVDALVESDAEYAIETGRKTGDVVAVSDWTNYVKKNSLLFNNGNSVLGSAYGPQTVDSLPVVPAADYAALSDVADTGFWSPYGP